MNSFELKSVKPVGLSIKGVLTIFLTDAGLNPFSGATGDHFDQQHGFLGEESRFRREIFEENNIMLDKKNTHLKYSGSEDSTEQDTEWIETDLDQVTNKVDITVAIIGHVMFSLDIQLRSFSSILSPYSFNSDIISLEFQKQYV